MSTYNRSDATFGSLAAALGLIVAILLVMAWVVNGRSGEHIPSVDYGPDATALREGAEFTAYAPEGLPGEWVPTSTRLDTGDPMTWVLGFATPADRHAEFAIGDAGDDALIAEITEDGEPDGSTEIGGRTWERYYNEAEIRRSLVLQEGDTRLIVAGSADYEELGVLAGSLRAQG
ncbi:DUF4245 domain-containing protein [Nocardiopsis sediminis]|uniref:DUF4245 domain-containing protein n=1 Tax=Nocardiopsis sediminis TaxID=1778267 RepID=A0ABV8FLS6_9ACTN